MLNEKHEERITEDAKKIITILFQLIEESEKKLASYDTSPEEKKSEVSLINTLIASLENFLESDLGTYRIVDEAIKELNAVKELKPKPMKDDDRLSWLKMGKM